MLISVFVSGCAGVQSHWREAESKNTIAGYEEFLTKHPQGGCAHEARARIVLLEYETAKNIDTIDAYDSFIMKYPNWDYADLARTRIEELKYEMIKESDTIEAYEVFLREYPNSSRKSSIKQRVEQLAYLETIDKGTADACESFVERYPESRHVDEVTSKLEELYNKADSVFAMIQKVKVVVVQEPFIMSRTIDGYEAPDDMLRIQAIIEQDLPQILSQCLNAAGFQVVEAGREVQVVAKYSGYLQYKSGGFISLNDMAFSLELSFVHPNFGTLRRYKVHAPVVSRDEPSHGPDRFFGKFGLLKFEEVSELIQQELPAVLQR